MPTLQDQDPKFQAQVQAAFGLPSLPEGYQFASLEVLVDGVTILYQTQQEQFQLPLSLPILWLNCAVFFDDQLVYARINGDPMPQINRVPQVYAPLVDFA